MLSVREERAIVGGVELARKTVIAATDEGIVATEIIERRENTVIDLPGSVPAIVAPSAPLALPSPPQPIIQDSRPSSSEFSWMDCCFRCDSDHEWYELQGKGFCLVLLLLLGYLIAGVAILTFYLACCVIACLTSVDCDD